MGRERGTRGGGHCCVYVRSILGKGNPASTRETRSHDAWTTCRTRKQEFGTQQPARWSVYLLSARQNVTAGNDLRSYKDRLKAVEINALWGRGVVY